MFEKYSPNIRKCHQQNRFGSQFYLGIRKIDPNWPHWLQGYKMLEKMYVQGIYDINLFEKYKKKCSSAKQFYFPILRLGTK